MASFDATPDAGPRPATASGVAVFSASPLVADGLVGLLPREWRDRILVVSETGELEACLDGRISTVIIDTDTSGAGDAILLSRTRVRSLIALTGSETARVAPELLDHADAVIDRYEAEPLTLRVAIAAGHIGMRLVPRSAPHTSAAGDQELVGGTLSEPARRALAMLAAGMRDAEIAGQLNLSESSVRKLVQRTVRAVGARTRCQAVAIVARSGEPEPAAPLASEPVAPS